MTIDDPYRAYVAQRRAARQWRSLAETQPMGDGMAWRDGAELVNFASNDYLGLSRHPALIAAAREYAERFGAGATASRLITGNLPVYAAIEERLAQGKGTESALVMASGYQANVTVLAALADAEAVGKDCVVLADRLSHYSLLQGAMLGKARLARFQHNDYDHLERRLRQADARRAHRIIVSESVFGMDGDRADIGVLSELAARFGAMLYIDEAHATGLFGANGFGLCADHKGKVDVAMGTFGKALGSFGAYVGCRRTVRDYLLQRCGGLIYSTALPPAVLGSMLAALELLPGLDAARNHVQAQAAQARDDLTRQGWDCGASTTQIIPVILRDEGAALALSERLRDTGLLVPAIRPPTVPRGTSRLRLSLSAAHGTEAIARLIAAMAQQVDNFAFSSPVKLAG